MKKKVLILLVSLLFSSCSFVNVNDSDTVITNVFINRGETL